MADSRAFYSRAFYSRAFYMQRFAKHSLLKRRRFDWRAFAASSEKMHAICDCFSASFFAHRRRSALAVMLSKA
jgi:hypothetical protein